MCNPSPQKWGEGLQPRSNLGHQLMQAQGFLLKRGVARLLGALLAAVFFGHSSPYHNAASRSGQSPLR